MEARVAPASATRCRAAMPCAPGQLAGKRRQALVSVSNPCAYTRGAPGRSTPAQAPRRRVRLASSSLIEPLTLTSLVVARSAQPGPRVHSQLVVDHRQVLGDGHHAQLHLLLGALDP